MKRLSLVVVLLLLVAASLAPSALAQDPTFPPMLDPEGVDRVTPRTIAEARKLQDAVVELVDRVRPAVVGLRVGQAGGSGTLISEDGWVATAAHVTMGVNRPVTIFLSDGTSFQGRTMGMNRPRDYALIKFDPGERKLPFVNMGNSDKVEVGQWVVSMGHPLGTETSPFRPPVVRLGRVSNTHPHQIVADAPLISGDSGGPMFDLMGNLQGINVSIQITSPKINNATPINLLKDSIDRLKAGENFGGDGNSMADLQAAIQAAYETLDKAFQDEDPAKFKEAENAFKAAIDLDPNSGDSWYHLCCCYSRWSNILDGDEKQAMVTKCLDTLSEAVDKGWSNLTHMTDDPDMDILRDLERFRELVIRIRRNTGQDAYLGLSGDTHAGNRGFRVTSVGDKGPAQRAGIEVNDLLTKFGDRDIRSEQDLKDAMKLYRPGDQVDAVVERNGEELRLVIVLSGRESAGGVVSNKDHANWRASFTSVCEAASKVTVRVAVNRRASGYGIIIRSDGVIITKNSELGNRPRNISVILPGGESVAAEKLAEDDQLDLALLRVANRDLPAAKFAESEAVKLGAFLFSVGTDPVPFCVGVRSLNQYITLRAADRPFLGISVRPLDNPMIFGVEYGVLVDRVELRSGADRAGVRRGDVLYQIGNTAIRGQRDVARAVSQHRVGDTIDLHVMRNQVPEKLRATLTKRPGTEDEGGGLGGLFQRLQGFDRIKGPANKRESGFGSVIQHDGIVTPDKTGGPIVDLDGRIVGINIGRSDRTKTYAIPTEVLKQAIPQLIERAGITSDEDDY